MQVRITTQLIDIPGKLQSSSPCERDKFLEQNKFGKYQILQGLKIFHPHVACSMMNFNFTFYMAYKIYQKTKIYETNQ